MGVLGVPGEHRARRPASAATVALQGAGLGTLGVSTPTTSWAKLGSKWAAVLEVRAQALRGGEEMLRAYTTSAAHRDRRLVVYHLPALPCR